MLEKFRASETGLLVAFTEAGFCKSSLLFRYVRIAVIETGVHMVLADHIKAEAVGECLLTGVARHHVDMPVG